MTTKGILHVEDDKNDAFLLQTMLERAGITIPLHLVTDGQMAIDYLSGTGQFADRQKYTLPRLVVTDLGLPKKSGLEVLQWMRQQACLEELVVVVFSSSALPQDVDRAYELGASAYIQKSADPDKLKEIVQLFKGWFPGHDHFSPTVKSRRADFAGTREQNR